MENYRSLKAIFGDYPPSKPEFFQTIVQGFIDDFIYVCKDEETRKEFKEKIINEAEEFRVQYYEQNVALFFVIDGAHHELFTERVENEETGKIDDAIVPQDFCVANIGEENDTSHYAETQSLPEKNKNNIVQDKAVQKKCTEICEQSQNSSTPEDPASQTIWKQKIETTASGEQKKVWRTGKVSRKHFKKDYSPVKDFKKNSFLSKIRKKYDKDKKLTPAKSRGFYKRSVAIMKDIKNDKNERGHRRSTRKTVSAAVGRNPENNKQSNVSIDDTIVCDSENEKDDYESYYLGEVIRVFDKVREDVVHYSEYRQRLKELAKCKNEISGSYYCPGWCDTKECSSLFADIKDFKQHIRRFEFLCKLCKRGYTRIDSCSDHVVNKHTRAVEEICSFVQENM